MYSIDIAIDIALFYSAKDKTTLEETHRRFMLRELCRVLPADSCKVEFNWQRLVVCSSGVAVVQDWPKLQHLPYDVCQLVVRCTAIINPGGR